MKVIIIDSNSKRATANSQALKTAAQGRSVEVKIIEVPTDYDKSKDARPDLLLLHDPEEATQTIMSDFQPASTLRYTAAGIATGIPRVVSGDSPITVDEASAILRVVETTPPQNRNEEFSRIWSGVPEVLLAWALVQHISSPPTETVFNSGNVADAYNKLWSALQIKNSTLPPRCVSNQFPVLANAKELLRLARMDI